MLIDSIRGVEAYPRGDYKKLLDLMEAYIGLSEGQFQFLGCCAVHKARWMGKQLYCYKMAMLQEYILKKSLPSLSYKRFLDLWTSAHLFLIRGGPTVPLQHQHHTRTWNLTTTSRALLMLTLL